MSRKFQMWFCLLIGVPYFIYAFLKISVYLIDVFIYKTDKLDTKGGVYIAIMLLFMAATGFMVRLGINALKGKQGGSNQTSGPSPE